MTKERYLFCRNALFFFFLFFPYVGAVARSAEQKAVRFVCLQMPGVS